MKSFRDAALEKKGSTINEKLVLSKVINERYLRGCNQLQTFFRLRISKKRFLTTFKTKKVCNWLQILRLLCYVFFQCIHVFGCDGIATQLRRSCDRTVIRNCEHL